MTDTTQQDARHVEEPPFISGLRRRSPGSETVIYIDALLAANRELRAEKEEIYCHIEGQRKRAEQAETRALAAQKDALEFAVAIFGSWVSRDYLNDDGMFGCDHCAMRFNDVSEWPKIKHQEGCVVEKAREALDAAAK